MRCRWHYDVIVVNLWTAIHSNDIDAEYKHDNAEEEEDRHVCDEYEEDDDDDKMYKSTDIDLNRYR